MGSYPFTTWTDISNTTSTFTLDIPRSFRECLGGYEGSVLDVLRCEYEWDNLTVKLHARRGADNGVRIAYGKNLTDFVQEQNNENVYDGVYGYAVVDEVTYEASNYFNKTGATTPKILNVDFSSDYETGQVPTAADLLSKATTYAQNNPIEVPSVNIKIDFIPLWQTEEYKDILQLERVSLGDTVHVYFDKLNVEASARVIKTEWNVLTNKYDSIELGDAKANMNTVINSVVNTAVDDKIGNLDIDVGYIENDLNDLGKLIINGLGLYFTREELATGGYRFYLHNQPTLANSDIQYYMSANGLMVSTDGGQTWNAGFNAQGEMILQALSTITLRALEIYGSFLRFGDVNSNYIDVAPYSINDVPQGVSFDGSGYVRLQPQEAFIVNNKAVGGSNNYNTFTMSKNGSSSQNYIALTNYDDLHNYLIANWVYMYSHYGTNSSNITGLSNFATSTGTRYTANTFSLETYSTRSMIALRNYNQNSSNLANYIEMTVGANSNNIIIRNQDSSANVQNYISMNSSTATLTVWSSSDIYINSDGAVRIYSGSGQDIQIVSADSLKLSYTKLYFNGTQRNLNFRSDGYVTWS